MVAFLRRWWQGKSGRPAALITGVAAPDDGGWSIFFVSEGWNRPTSEHGR
jgi:hypothetical protein